jgi:hypothetical protein
VEGGLFDEVSLVELRSNETDEVDRLVEARLVRDLGLRSRLVWVGASPPPI